MNCLSSIYNIEKGVMENQKDIIKLTYKECHLMIKWQV